MRFNFTGNVAGNSFAAFLLGAADVDRSPEGLPLTDILQNRTALYFNDDWKPLRRLTLNLGLRWEYNSPATDVQGLWRSAEWLNGLNSPPEYVPAQIRTVYHFYEAAKNTVHAAHRPGVPPDGRLGDARRLRHLLQRSPVEQLLDSESESAAVRQLELCEHDQQRRVRARRRGV